MPPCKHATHTRLRLEVWCLFSWIMKAVCLNQALFQGVSIDLLDWARKRLAHMYIRAFGLQNFTYR